MVKADLVTSGSGVTRIHHSGLARYFRRERSGEEAGSAVARLSPPRPELEPAQDQYPAGHKPGRAARGHARVRQVAEAGGHQRAEPADHEGTLADPVVGAKSEATGQDEEGRHEE